MKAVAWTKKSDAIRFNLFPLCALWLILLDLG